MSKVNPSAGTGNGDTRRHVVEVSEGVVEVSEQGVGWWQMFSLRYAGTDRLRYTKEPCVVGGVVEVACDDRDDAEWLAAHMVEYGGMPRSAVRVRAVSS